MADPNMASICAHKKMKERNLTSPRDWLLSSQSADLKSQQVFWLALSSNCLNVNLDGSFLEIGKAGYGVIIRNHLGLAIAVSFGQTSVSPIQAEAMAFLKGLELLKSLNFPKAILESNAQISSKLFNRRSKLAQDAIFICRDIFELY
uniref:RNase H type-1 domain-containing protein n=1 Tax=Nelumbo nucifera TaxID=4432 RepID=A0A822XSD3_NELNU|nr:TPA_asm: hypothetical protein HUJ06_023534 [Nelumbo nucifera]